MLYLFSMLQRKGNGSTSSARHMTPALRGQRKVLGKGALQHLCVRLTSELGRGCSLRTAALTLQFTLGVFTYPKMNVTKYVQVPRDSLSFTPMWETLWRAEIPKDPFRPPSPFPKKRVQLLSLYFTTLRLYIPNHTNPFRHSVPEGAYLRHCLPPSSALLKPHNMPVCFLNVENTG